MNRLALALAAAALAVALVGAAAAGHAAVRHTLSTGDLVFDQFGDVDTLAGTPSAPTVVVSTSSLAPGNYEIAAKVTAAGRANAFARAVCELRYPGWSGSIATTDMSSATVGEKKGAAEDQTLSLLYAVTTSTSGSVSLVCWPEEASGHAAVVTNGSLAVTEVGSIRG
jgi:hypothetical protein